MKTLNDLQNDIILFDLYRIHNIKHKIFEGSGLYKDCYELSCFIYEKIMNNKRKLEFIGELIIFSDEVKELSNIFFEKLTIYNSKNFQYLIKTRTGELNKWNKDKKIFSNIDIEIELNVEKDDFIALISHELNHAFRDYKLHLYDSELKIDKNYIKTKLNGNESTYENIVKNIRYYLYDFEMSAFIAQISSKIQNKKFNSLHDAYNFISSDNIYRNISMIYRYIQLINIDKYELKLCENAWYKIFNEKLNLNKITKQVNHFYTKLINHSYLAISEKITK